MRLRQPNEFLEPFGFGEEQQWQRICQSVQKLQLHFPMKARLEALVEVPVDAALKPPQFKKRQPPGGKQNIEMLKQRIKDKGI